METEESFTPLSTGDTEEQLTIPSGEDTEASTVQQSKEVQGKEADDLQQAEETAVVMIKVKALERPKVARQQSSCMNLQHQGKKVGQRVHLWMCP